MPERYRTRYTIEVFCPHPEVRDQKVIRFTYDDGVREATDEYGDTFLYEALTPVWTAGKIGESAEEAAVSKAGIGTIPIEELRRWDQKDQSQSPDLYVVRRVATHLTPPHIADKEREERTLADEEKHEAAGNAHDTYRIACKLCHTGTSRRHNNVVPVLDALAADGAHHVTRVWFVALLDKYLRG